jgi:hypothetical protein
MSVTVRSVSETLKNKGGYTLKEKVRVFVDKTILGFRKSKKFKISDAEAIDEFVRKNGQIIGLDFYSDKGKLKYLSGWDGKPNKFYIDGVQYGMRYFPNEANIRGVMVIDI